MATTDTTEVQGNKPIDRVVFGVAAFRQARHFLGGSGDRAAAVMATDHATERGNAGAQGVEAGVVGGHRAMLLRDVRARALKDSGITTGPWPAMTRFCVLHR